jgi:1,4-dihydroxy-2-naphthoyl-CoA hydrolase
MDDTDAAGVIYFANQLQIAHEGFENFLDSIDLGVRHMLEKTDYRIPIVHVESDYKAAIRVGEPLEIRMTVERIGESSFTLLFGVHDRNGREVGTAKIVHCAVDAATWKKRPLPDELRAPLAQHLR